MFTSAGQCGLHRSGSTKVTAANQIARELPWNPSGGEMWTDEANCRETVHRAIVTHADVNSVAMGLSGAQTVIVSGDGNGAIDGEQLRP
jgi:hypothetical protein